MINAKPTHTYDNQRFPIRPIGCYNTGDALEATSFHEHMIRWNYHISIATEITDFVVRNFCKTIDMTTALTPTTSIPYDGMVVIDWKIVVGKSYCLP